MSCGRRRSRGLVGCSLLAFCLIAPCASGYAAEGPPRFHVRAPAGALTFVVYGDTRFTKREHVAHVDARRALVAKIASEQPAAILVGGDLVYEGRDPEEYKIYKSETGEWATRKIAVFPALGNHELKGCEAEDASPCLENWWATFESLRPYRWYTVAFGATLLAVILDSNSSLRPESEQRQWFERQITEGDARFPFILVLLHYPPVRDPIYPAMLDERLLARYLSDKARSLHAQVVVVGSHEHNYERFNRGGITYFVSGGGGANPVPAMRMFGELSKLTTGVNFHYLRFVLDGERLTATMVRFDDKDQTGHPWTEPDHSEVRARH
jgi:calcineurin-like phosphoesterase family protein